MVVLSRISASNKVRLTLVEYRPWSLQCPYFQTFREPHE